MIPNLKALVLAALAAFAFTAGSAAASGEKFHSSQAHTILSAEQTSNQVLTTTAGTLTCTKAIFSGTTTEVTPGQITAENIAYTGCALKTISGNFEAHVEFKGCDYLLTADTSQLSHILCPDVKGPVTITAPGCTITVNTQTVNGVTYSNSGSHVNINWSVNNITSHGTGTNCSTQGTSNHGAYTGTMTVKGTTTAGGAVTISSTPGTPPSGEKFHAGQAHTILSAEQTSNHVFTTTAGTLTCTRLTFNGTTTEVTPGQITAENIKYTECTTKTIFGNLSATVDFKGCDYLFTADKTQPTHIVCPAGTGPITVTAPGCTITWPAQTLNGFTYSNNGSHINVNAAVTNMTSHATGSFCSTTGTSTHGSFVGTVTVKGASTDGAAVAVSYG